MCEEPERLSVQPESVCAEDQEGDLTSPIENWDDMNLSPDLMRGVFAIGFERPSPIQARAIRPVVEGRDVVGQAQSGTGKTGCFAIAALQRVDPSLNKTQVLILSPTRELSQQTQKVVERLSVKMPRVRSQLLVGGTSTDADASALMSSPPQVVVGCPGRVHDMLRRRRLRVDALKVFILDEADEMLSQGFKEQVYDIFQFLGQSVQIALFSATMPPAVHSLTEKFMRNPVQILVKAAMLTLEGIQQHYVALDDDEQKYGTLKDLYSMLTLSQCIVYCNSVRRVQDLYDAMQADQFPVCQMHSGMDREERQQSYADFSSGKTRVLISSNVTARGIDVQQVSTVINFDVPRDVETYLHRIGRSGRWGRKGMGINFVTRRDTHRMREIERHYATTITELPADIGQRHV